jgi:hypothetical protein
MGVVYLARDPRLERRVALKTYALPAGLTEDDRREFRARFEREARAAAALSHPGIVTVYDVDSDARLGAPFIAMEYVEGGSLHDLLRRRERLDPAEACNIARQVADALQAAHDAGIVHRDVKPANILIDSADGRAKIADFGVARLTESELTRSGTTFGSPSYMSPEQIRFEVIDGRSDLFSLGVILYQMIAGARPFAGDDLPALGYSIVHETPLPVTRRVSDVPRGLDGFFARALAKSPDERFAGGREFSDALARAMESVEPEPGEYTTILGRPSDAETPMEDIVSTSYGAAPLPNDLHEACGASGNRRVLLTGLAAGLLLLAGMAMLLWVDAPAYLELHGRSTIQEGTLTVFLDGREVYRRDLAFSGDRATLTKLLGPIRPAAGGETFETVIETTAGRHEVEAVLAETADGRVHRSSVVVELEDRGSERLRLIAGKTRGAPMSLKRD